MDEDEKFRKARVDRLEASLKRLCVWGYEMRRDLIKTDEEINRCMRALADLRSPTAYTAPVKDPE